MKKIMLVFLLFPCWAMAAEKCVTLDPSGTAICAQESEVNFDTADWMATCPSSNGIPVRGIAACAKTPGNTGDVSDDLEISADASENTYCWCKLVSPAVSRWVAYGDIGSSTMCIQACAGIDCEYELYGSGNKDQAFRREMFSNLKD